MSYSSRCGSPQSVASSILAPSTDDFCNTADTIYQDSVKSHPRHNRYYFSDGNVIFLVEGILYNIHRYFFERDSSTFASMFSLPFGGRGEGLTDDQPIHLNKIKSRDFDLFLSILYPAEFGLYTAATVDEWTAILDLAAKWNFRSIKTLAIKQLTPIASPIDKIVWGRKHQINEWLGDAYRSVCARSEPLTYEEGMRLGMEDVIKISATRHENGWCTPWSNQELQRRFGLDVVLLPPLPPSLDDRNSEANRARLPEPSDDNSLATQEVYPSSQWACSPSGPLTEAAPGLIISDNTNAVQWGIGGPTSDKKARLNKAQKKLKQQQAQEAKYQADREFQEQFERELAEEAQFRQDFQP